MMVGVKAKYWAVIGADKHADNSPNWAIHTGNFGHDVKRRPKNPAFSARLFSSGLP